MLTLMKGDKVVEVAEETADFLLLICICWTENLNQSQIITIDCRVTGSSTIIQDNFYKAPILNKAHQKIAIYIWSHLSVSS